MSHIFDALVRSKTERASDGETSRSVTDLLENAERQSAIQRDAEVRGVNLDPAAPASSRPAGALEEDSSMLSIVQGRSTEESAVQGSKGKLDQAFPSTHIAIPDGSRLVSFTDPKSPAAEAFRLLGVRVRHLRRERTLNKVLITSTAPQEGKSTVAANLAYTLAAEKGAPVLLLEGDLRKPTLAKTIGLDAAMGLSDYLQSKCELKSSIYRLEETGFWLLPAGRIPHSPLDALQSSQLQDLMKTLEEMFDWIIIDSPPFLPLADASIWERWADGVVVVVRQGVTQKRKLQKGLDAIDEQKLLCALLNSSKNENIKDYYYYHHDGQD